MNHRKSKRLQNQSAVGQGSLAGLGIGGKSVKIHDSKLTANSTVDRKQLNGAQFVAAAAAGNFNVSASIGSTSITIDSNANVDLNQLNQNVELLSSTLKQHSLFMKQLNSSIEKLSQRLDLKEATGGVKRQRKSSTRRLKSQPVVVQTVEHIVEELEQQIEECESDDELDQTETIEVPVRAQVELTDKNTEKLDTESSFTEIESINQSQKTAAANAAMESEKNAVDEDMGNDDDDERSKEGVGCEKVEAVSAAAAFGEKNVGCSPQQQGHSQQVHLQTIKSELQTVKLTNAGLEMEKHTQIQSNNAYFSSGNW